MWGQVGVIFLGTWLAISPFFFSSYPVSLYSYTDDFLIGALCTIFGFTACFYKSRIWTVLICLLATGIFAQGYFLYSHPRAPIAQNQIIVALLILMFAVIPLDDKIKKTNSST
jgi:hypothetical protein